MDLRRCTLVMLVCFAGCGHRRAADFTVDAATRRALVADVLAELDGKYVSAELAARNHSELARRWSSVDFEQLGSARALMQRMSADMRELFHDKHLGLIPASGIPESALGPDRPLSAAELAEERNEAERNRYGIRSAKILDGNIGYIVIDGFPVVQLPEVGDAIAAAMTTVAGSRALILDLRGNHGGDGDTVALWMSYLLDDKKLLLQQYDRTTGKTSEDWTRATVPGRRYGAARPLFVLTSHETFSAGEEIAYDVQTLGRGTLVGETTGGGANHNMFVRVGGGAFVLSVAFGSVKSPVTGTNWEGVGVKPDVAVAADRALDVALERARGRYGTPHSD